MVHTEGIPRHGNAAHGLNSLIITDLLGSRSAHPPDHAAEARALTQLAEALVDPNANILQQLVDAALDLCAAHSAGISLLDPDRTKFVWPAIAGKWSAYVGGGTPRDFGPCGTVLDRNEALLFTHPERHFTYLVDAVPAIEEALLLPFTIDGEAIGTVWVVSHDTTRSFDTEDLRVLTALGQFAAIAYQTRSTLTALRVSDKRLRESEARQAAQLAIAQRLQAISTELILEADDQAILNHFLTAAIAIAGSDMASIQMLHPGRGQLQLLAHSGFPREAAEFWEWVTLDGASTCGAALAGHTRVIVSDIEQCEFMAGTRDLEMYRISNVRAVQSTPLLSRSGRLLGMISTHWSRPHEPDANQLRMLDVLARQAADLIARSRAAALAAGQNRVLEMIASGADLQVTLTELIRLVEEQSDGYVGSILVRNPDDLNFSMAVAPSLPDVQNRSAEWRDLVTGLELTGCYSTPIVATNGKILGSFGWYSRSTRSSDPPDQHLLELAAHLAGIAIDRKQVQEALARSTAQNQTLLAAAPLGVYLIDANFRIRDVNPTARLVFGDIPDLIGRDFNEVIDIMVPRPQGEEILTRFRHTLATGESYRVPELAAERRDRGVVEYYEWAIHRLQLPDGRYGVVCYFTDISAQVLARLAISNSEQRLRFMAESMPQKIFTATPAGDVDYFNQQWMEFTGLSFEQIRDWGWTQFIHPEDVEENVRQWKHSIETGELFQFEHRFRHRDGEYRWHLSRAHAMRDADGRIAMWIGSNTEIHQQRRAAEERQLLLQRERQALENSERLRHEADAARAAAERANAAKGEFLAKMSHELRTPLNAIGGYVDLLELGIQGPINPAQTNSLNRIKRSSQHLLGLINDVLDLSRIDAGQIEYNFAEVSVDEIWRDTETMLAPQLDAKKLSCTYRPEVTALTAWADREKLQQILLNLLGNAVKFTEPGGEIGVDVRPLNGNLEIRVIDNGRGIAPEKLDFIFEPFVQADRRLNNPGDGVGLGLAISREFAEGMGGTLTAENSARGGATFLLILRRSS